MGTADHREESSADEGEKHLAALQNLWAAHWVPDAEAPMICVMGVAMEVLEQQHDLEQVRALLGHARIDTTQIYTMIRPSHLKQVVLFYEEPARQMLTS